MTAGEPGSEPRTAVPKVGISLLPLRAVPPVLGMQHVSQAWTWVKIRREWLGDARISIAPRTVVDAFARVERLLGAEWLNRARPPAGTTGIPWTLHVASAGVLLGLAEQLPGGDVLIAEARAGRREVWSELEGIQLIRRTAPYVTIRVRIKVPVRGKVKVPDFAVRDGSRDPFTFVEVTTPERSLEHQRLQARMSEMAGLIESIPGHYAIEVFLRRVPTDVEWAALGSRIRQIATVTGAYEEELPDGLGRIFANQHPPGQFVAEDHGEETPQPRFGIIRAVIEGRVGNGRDIAVRVPFTDDRADSILKREARQLPVEGPGLVMFDVQHDQLGGWAKMIERRFLAGMHTRVTAAVLFSSGIESGLHGEELRTAALLVRNPNAKVGVPLWAEGLRQFDRRDVLPRLAAVTRHAR